MAPLVLGAVVRAVGWRGRRIEQAERDEDAAIVLPVAALCWQPVVILTDLREQLPHGGAVTLTATIAAIVLAVYCVRR